MKLCRPLTMKGATKDENHGKTPAAAAGVFVFVRAARIVIQPRFVVRRDGQGPAVPPPHTAAGHGRASPVRAHDTIMQPSTPQDRPVRGKPIPDHARRPRRRTPAFRTRLARRMAMRPRPRRSGRLRDGRWPARRWAARTGVLAGLLPVLEIDAVGMSVGPGFVKRGHRPATARTVSSSRAVTPTAASPRPDRPSRAAPRRRSARPGPWPGAGWAAP